MERLQLRIASHSEVGLIRKNNQDSGYASPQLLVVADGMGGAAAGDLASAVAIDTLRHLETGSDGPQMLELLTGAIADANDRIAELVEADSTLDGMGTTVTSAMFDGTQLGLAHIGDSRAYLLRDGKLDRLTHDHSWVQSLVDEGKITAAEAAYHPHRSLLLKVLNGQPANDPDLTIVSVRAGDRLMLCSDGVCGLVDDAEIAKALALPTLDDALEHLVSESLAEGGIDNITVIVADVVGGAGTVGETVLGAAAIRSIPAASGASDSPDTEDTLITARRTPAGARTAPRPAADEERYRPQAPGRRRFSRPLIVLTVVLLMLAAALGSAYAWTRTQYFVGAAGNQVAIYQGLSDGLPGLRLSEVYEVHNLALTDLPPYYQDRVRATIGAAGLEGARATVVELKETARRCAAQGPRTPKPATTPSKTATPKPATTPAASPRPSAGATPATPDC